MKRFEGGLEESLIDVLEGEIRKGLDGYYSCAWRDKLGKLLESESRYVALAKWAKEKRDFNEGLMHTFSPADRDDGYTRGMLNTYLECAQKVCVLTHLYELLIDGRTTDAMRENIEYTLCKVYGLRYSEYLKEYIESSEVE